MKIELNIPDILRAARQDPDLTSRMGQCRYTAPCVIALGMTPEQRLQVSDKAPIGSLIATGAVAFPSWVQGDDAMRLQEAYDTGTPDELRILIDELEEKYL